VIQSSQFVLFDLDEGKYKKKKTNSTRINPELLFSGNFLTPELFIIPIKVLVRKKWVVINMK